MVIAVMFALNRDLLTRLEQWQSGRRMGEGRIELRAWQQANALPRNYGLAALGWRCSSTCCRCFCSFR